MTTTRTKTFTVKFSRSGWGRRNKVLHYRPCTRTTDAFIEDLRRVGASPITIAAAEGRTDDVKRLAKEARLVP